MKKRINNNGFFIFQYNKTYLLLKRLYTMHLLPPYNNRLPNLISAVGKSPGKFKPIHPFFVNFTTLLCVS